jgi:hypothetical protein
LAKARIAHSLEFVDRAARYVSERLDQDVSLDEHDVGDQHDVQVLRWLWTDQQANQFFQAHPNGLGIEIESGLSTRFHRVSDQLQQPQFSWCTINTQDVVDCLHYVFFQLNNYTNIACVRPMLDWVRYVPWRDDRPKIVFIGDQNPLLNWEDFVSVSVDIQSKLTDFTPQLDVLVTHSIVCLGYWFVALPMRIKCDVFGFSRDPSCRISN